jgi:hypothetical protein
VSKTVSPHCLDHVGRDGLGFGALDSNLDLLAIGHEVPSSGLCFRWLSEGEAAIPVQSVMSARG